MQGFFWTLSFACGIYITTSVQTLYKWNYLNYAWLSLTQMNHYISSGKYDYRKMIPVDVDRARDGRIFVTVPKDKGVPASVNTIIMSNRSPLLKPFPNWDMYEDHDPCNTILNVHRIAIDDCNRLWMIDTGTLGDKRLCPAKIYAFNLSNNSLFLNIEIPKEYSENKQNQGLLVNLNVETSGSDCDHTQLYIADSDGYGLIKYTVTEDNFYRSQSPHYKPEEENVNFSVAGEEFILAKGITGMALSPMRYPDGARVISFLPLSSRTIYNVDRHLIEFTGEGINLMFYDSSYRLPSQGSSLVYSPGGLLFFGLTRETAIACANPFKSLAADSYVIILQDSERLQFISSMKFIKNSYMIPEEEYLLVLSNRFQKYLKGTMNFSEINFRILKLSLKSLILQGTICDYN